MEAYEIHPEIYCPNCGKNGILIDTGPDDYYGGPDHICLACWYIFHITYDRVVSPNDAFGVGVIYRAQTWARRDGGAT